MALCTPIDRSTFPGTTLASPYAPGSGTMVVASAAGLGTPSSGAPVRITVAGTSGTPVAHYKVTGISGNTLTVAVADGYADASFSTGATVAVNVTAATVADIHAALSSLGGQVPPAGGTTGQVLSKASGTDYAMAWSTPAAGNPGTVTTVSASVPAGLSVAVTNPTTTPAIAVTTTLSGVVKGTGSGFAAAVAGTDYVSPAGTYSDPAWITSLAGAKISGTVGAATVAGSATTISGTIAESQVVNLVADLGGKLAAASNLADLPAAGTARTNLGLGSAAVHPATDFAGSLAPTGVKTSAYAANPGEFVPVDATSAGVTIALPSAPADRSVVAVKLIATGSGHVATVACSGSDVLNKAGGTTSGTLSLINQGAAFQYQSSAGIWYVTGDDLPLSQLDGRYATASQGTLAASAVQSISLATPNVLYATPITFSVASGAATGTLSLNAQAANVVFAGPTTGANASPTMRALVAADIPALPYAPTAGSTSIVTLGTVATGVWNATVIGVSKIGTGTPSAGKYVDGGTGAWTTLPAATVASGTAGRVPFEGAGGVLTDSAALAYDGSTLSAPAACLTGTFSSTSTVNGVWAGLVGSATTVMLGSATASQSVRLDNGGGGQFRIIINGQIPLSATSSSVAFGTGIGIAVTGANVVAVNGDLQSSYQGVGPGSGLWSPNIYADRFSGGAYGGTAPSSGFGAYTVTRLTGAAGIVHEVERKVASLVVATDASFTTRVSQFVEDWAGTREAWRAESDGTQPLLGFYGVAAVAKAGSPGTATGTDAAVINAIVALLRNLGLCS